MYFIIIWALLYKYSTTGVHKPIAPPPVPFELRLAQAIRNNMTKPVVLNDILGEGAGAWDSEPRYDETTPVNCLIWLQQILAEAYSPIATERALVMDQLRYYGGVVSFATRKHYTEHWLHLEPGPFTRVAPERCGKSKIFSVNLDPEKFLRSKQYSCPLFQQKKISFDISYSRAEELEKCLPDLDTSRYYVLFAVPTKKYRETYLVESGPMGLVHAMLLRPGDSLQKSIVYHASTSAGSVLAEQSSVFFERMKKLHLGYVIYGLTSDWDAKNDNIAISHPGYVDELVSLARCERSLK